MLFLLLTFPVVRIKGVVVCLVDNETGNLELVAACGLSEEFQNKGSVSIEKSIAQALKGETVIIEDASTDKTGCGIKRRSLKKALFQCLCLHQGQEGSHRRDEALQRCCSEISSRCYYLGECPSPYWRSGHPECSNVS